jgi:hypothetical protein
MLHEYHEGAGALRKVELGVHKGDTTCVGGTGFGGRSAIETLENMRYELVSLGTHTCFVLKDVR